MKLTKFSVNACCGKTTTIFQTSEILSKEIIAKLVSQGFIEHEKFSKNNVLYVENAYFFLSGPIGSNRLQVRCKKGDCSTFLPELEEALTQI